MLGVRLSQDLEDKMNAYLKTAKVTKSYFVKQAVTVFLRQEELKKLHDEMTLQGIKEIRAGKGIPGDVVLKMLAQWS